MSESDIRAASQVGVINGIGEVPTELDALGGERAEDVFADSSGEHSQGVCRPQSNQILLSSPLFYIKRKQQCPYGEKQSSLTQWLILQRSHFLGVGSQEAL